ncbi:heterokaryon incompatibility [Penicillium verhagenii]|uniref:heterokaryon incompatibility n=1 Tax=Penicillium verhagenii TaxID=1562060 RepID=UPI002545B2A1|nr:heterokaryon incompatibility [Penicillium verhagenii]KAJ5927936.1 heterokaryon incompatibility [Penicillium verhagenii]
MEEVYDGSEADIHDVTHHEKHSFEQTDACRLCTESLLNIEYGEQPSQDEAKRLAELLFHGTCSNAKDDNEDQQLLCEFCRHLRLNHLLECLKDSKLRYSIRFCSFNHIEKRKSCSFCRLLIQSALPYAFFAGTISPASFKDGWLDMIVEPRRSIFMKFQFPGGSWRGGKRVYFDSKGVESPCAGFIKRIGGFVNWDLLSGWLNDCSEGVKDHSECGPKLLGVKPAHFRLIDVHRRRLVSAPHDCRYVALSYVWGSNPDMSKMTTTATLESLQKDGALVISNVAKTINDAITICSQLQQEYLWVDQYCIIQDSKSDQAEQIASMAAIYSSAEFVIISTDGDMNDGIPGVGVERAQKQLGCKASGIEFIAEIAGWRDITIGGSIWSTRGWTYQEGILGRRKLYFTSSQSFFECDTDVLNEDEGRQQALYSPNKLNPQRWSPFVDCFYSHVCSYAMRHLGNEFDIYNAIEGIASALYAAKHPLWLGLPRNDFDKALLWCPDAGASENEILKSKVMPGGLIPSWSWSSSKQSVLLLDDCNRRPLRYCGPLVTWNSFRKTDEGYKIESLVPNSAVDFQCPRCKSGDEPTGNAYDGKYKDEQLLQIVVAWSQGCIDSAYPFKPLTKTSIRDLEKSIDVSWQCKHHSWQFQALRNRPSNDFLSRMDAIDKSLKDKLGPDLIFTRAQSGFFKLNLPTDQSQYLRDYPIVENGKTVGVLIGQDADLQAELLPRVEAGQNFEFIALSVSSMDGIICSDGTTQSGNLTFRDPKKILAENESLRDLTYLDARGVPILPIPVVNVMLIRRARFGLTAQRMSIGWIYLKVWAKARAEFRDVFLE